MYKNEVLKSLNNSVTYDRGVCLKYLSLLIYHLSFLICHGSYESTEKKCFFWFVKLIYKMSYYWLNREEILQKAKEKYSMKKAAEYYKQNREAIKEKLRECYKNLSQEEKDKKKEYQKKKTKNWFIIKKKR